jgi:hypothetical protein
METLGMWENYYLDAYEYTKEVSGKWIKSYCETIWHNMDGEGKW